MKKFVFSGVFILVGLGLGGWYGQTGEEPFDIPVVDTHTHASFDDEVDPTSGIKATKEEYLREFKESGLVAAISHVGRTTDIVDDLKPLKVIQCAGLEAKVDAEKLEERLKSKKFSCIKIYLGYVHQFAYDVAYEPAYQLAEKYDVPVVFHTGDTYSSKAKLKYSDPLTIDEVAVDHPNVTFVIAHLGNPWIQSAAEVVFKNPNVYVEASALMIGDLSRVSAEDLDRYVVQPLSWAFGYVEDPSKFMFGSDWPLVNIKSYLEVYKKAIPKQYWRQVFYENAVKVFRLDRELGLNKEIH
ncbi:MAG: amidohydrolase family protein [Pseudomonadota bacterium]|nr:amidohydrolase family protein [Pseudomonadota bacterium]